MATVRVLKEGVLESQNLNFNEGLEIVLQNEAFLTGFAVL